MFQAKMNPVQNLYPEHGDKVFRTEAKAQGTGSSGCAGSLSTHLVHIDRTEQWFQEVVANHRNHTEHRAEDQTQPHLWLVKVVPGHTCRQGTRKGEADTAWGGSSGWGKSSRHSSILQAQEASF